MTLLTPVIGPLRQRVNSMTLFSQATAEANQVTVPSGVQKGDLMVMLHAANKASSSGNVAAPTGFTLLTSAEWTWATGNLFFTGVSYKIADGTESGTQITGQTSSNNVWEKGLFIFRGNVPIKSATPGGWNLQTVGGTDGNSTAQNSLSIGASASSPPTLRLAFYWNLSRARASAGQTVFSTGADGEHVWGIDNNAITKWEFNTSSTAPTNYTISTSNWNGVKMAIGGYFNVRN
jgi:hypothetical protein